MRTVVWHQWYQWQPAETKHLVNDADLELMVRDQAEHEIDVKAEQMMKNKEDYQNIDNG